MKILILGVTGMLGHTLFDVLSSDSGLLVYGTSRKSDSFKYFHSSYEKNIFCDVSYDSDDDLLKIFSEIRPTLVINCVGVVKQSRFAADPLSVVKINSLFPHRLFNLCNFINARLIHISTDCVFSGTKGNYSELDIPDPQDLYGRSKLLGELYFSPALTLRTSIIGHELSTSNGLLSWFLSQKGSVKGYSNAIFSGLTTYELSQFINRYLIYNDNLTGLYHISSKPIDKFSLLSLISDVYSKNISIVADHEVVIDRSLSSSRLKSVIDYEPPDWVSLIRDLYSFNLSQKSDVF